MSQFELKKVSVFRGEHDTDYDFVYEFKKQDHLASIYTVEEFKELAKLFEHELTTLRNKERKQLQDSIQYHKTQLKFLEKKLEEFDRQQ